MGLNISSDWSSRVLLVVEVWRCLESCVKNAKLWPEAAVHTVKDIQHPGHLEGISLMGFSTRQRENLTPTQSSNSMDVACWAHPSGMMANG